ncbi:DUF2306 domain-containing protein [Halorientalis regularis]|jgi:hypothetical protein|uniref:Predicted membrane protein n=1 Tax=Halorientalis regularis TaxID=660518 RepID=A0A1G7SU76_9EURY|nr:DUF2306 domain-containing protein [Halorientalis regularis]SDG26583.1 Predicted membrane protein [Halorientalis regularis]
MPTIETVTLGAHIAAGFLALFAGLGAILTEKGGRRHRRFGRIYVGSMAFVAGSALLLFALAPTPDRQFLALIAVFSFYFVFSGYRVLSRKRPADGPAALDWAAAGLLCLAGLGLLAMGALGLRDGSSFGTVLVVFGGISAVFGVRDIREFRTDESEPRAWFFEHLTRMGAGYIATVTAFSTVNFLFLPTVLRWLWPTLVGTPGIFLAIRRYERQFGTADG